MDFGKRLKAARKKTGYTQLQLANKVGVSKSTITSYETGAREPNVEMLKKLIEILNINSEELLGVETTKKSSESDLTGTEEEEQVYQILLDGLVHTGFLQAGEDITEMQLEVLTGVAHIIFATFAK